jgi:DNA-binding MarR family transcriptional regulator
LVEALSQQLSNPSELTAAGWQVVSVLGAGEATVPELADRLGRRRQTVQVAVDELARRGHVKKVKNPRNARSPKITLTSHGRRAFWDTVERQVSWVNAGAESFVHKDLQVAVSVVHDLVSLLTNEDVNNI